MTFITGLKAQNCTALVLPRFNGDTVAMADYPQEKQNWLCAFARSAFYESDTVPTGAAICPIGEVRANADGKYLTDSFVVDLTSLSFFAYNFIEIQHKYQNTDMIICFPTPNSKHPYLVMRSVNEMYAMADSMYN